MPKKNRHIAATLHFLFLASRLINLKNMEMIFNQLPILSNQHPMLSDLLNTVMMLIIARPLLTLIICSQIYQENLFVYLATRDIMNSVLNQFIISSLIVFVYLINCGTLGGGLTKDLQARHEIDRLGDVAVSAVYYCDIPYAIDSLFAIVFTLNGKRFKNPLIIRFFSDT
jgi:hypothetical protein